MSDITVRLNSWKGYSAYEVAVNNGFEGTEEEWLASLKGADGRTTSVNGQTVDDQGSITITGEDIDVATAGGSKTIAQLGAEMDSIAERVQVGETAIDVNGMYIDNALFR